MAKLLVNVRRKGCGFAGSSLRKIANKLRKTANRWTATNRSKVITREIRPSGYYSRSKENRKQRERREAEKRGKAAPAVTRSSFANFHEENQVTTHLQCNLETSSVRNSITLPTILTSALLSALSFTEKYLFLGNLQVSLTVTINVALQSVNIPRLYCVLIHKSDILFWSRLFSSILRAREITAFYTKLTESKVVAALCT